MLDSAIQATASEPRALFGRNRALAMLGAGLFGFAARMFAPGDAFANHQPAPYPCHGAHPCICCNGTLCCDLGGCAAVSDRCESGEQCWYVCWCGGIWACCDWINNLSGVLCICRARVGNSGCGC